MVLIAVHVGAGFHARDKEADYKWLCRQACARARKVLKDGGSAAAAAMEAAVCLEDSDMTNAGYGSNLALDGTVQCDASMMESGHGCFGGVGALEHVKNPIKVAGALMAEDARVEYSLGRMPPSMLCGDGARLWAIEHRKDLAIEVEAKDVRRSFLVSDAATVRYVKQMDLLNSSGGSRDETADTDGAHAAQDTIGVICMDDRGLIVAASSSGGTALKTPGRVSAAGLFGSGTWAESLEPEGEAGKARSAVGCVTTGKGEQIVKTVLARSCAQSLLHLSAREDDGETSATDAMNQLFRNHFYNSTLLKKHTQKHAGVLALQAHMSSEQGEIDAELVWSHSTPSMILAYDNGDICQSIASRLEGNQQVVLSGVHFTLPLLP